MIASTPKHGPTLIGAGLFLLLAAELWPAIPVASAAMLIALGATGVLMARAASRESGRWLIVVHLAIYAALYSLFVAALVDRSLRVAGQVAWTTAADLVIATCLLTLVVRLGLSAFRDPTANRC